MRWRVWIAAGWLALTAAVFWAGRAALPGRPPAAAPAPHLWTPTAAQAPPGPVPIVAGGPSTTPGDILGGNESRLRVAVQPVPAQSSCGTATTGATRPGPRPPTTARRRWASAWTPTTTPPPTAPSSSCGPAMASNHRWTVG